MSLLYGRRVNLLVGPRGGIGELITDLRVSFKVEKNSESNPNTATVSIYNLTQKSRSRFEKANSTLTVSAGYVGNVPQLFTGDITKIWTTKEGPDQVTVIEAADGDFSLNTSNVNSSFAPGAPLEQVFNQVVGSFGVGIGSMLGLPDTTYKHGLTVSGDSKKVMDDLTKKNDLEWSIQDGKINVHPKNGIVYATAVLLNSSTGLIGSPKRVKVLKYGTDPLIPDAHKDAGVIFKSLLNNKLKPGQLVKLAGVNVTGLFTVRKSVHQGDNWSGTWESDCEAV